MAKGKQFYCIDHKSSFGTMAAMRDHNQACHHKIATAKKANVCPDCGNVWETAAHLQAHLDNDPHVATNSKKKEEQLEVYKSKAAKKQQKKEMRAKDNALIKSIMKN